MSSWKDDGQIWDRSSGQRGELHFDKRCCSLQNLCETQRSWCALRMFVCSQFLRLYKTCMIAACVCLYDWSLLLFVWSLLASSWARSGYRDSRCRPALTDRSPPYIRTSGSSLSLGVAWWLFFWNVVNTVVDTMFNVHPCLLKCGGDCDGHQAHPFLLKCCGDCGWATVTFVSQACTKDCHQKQTAFGIGVGFGEACTWVNHVQAFGYWLTLESL